MVGHGMSNAVARQAMGLQSVERGRASCVLFCCRMTARVDNGNLREGMKALAHKRRRLGSCRLHILSRREGQEVNHKRLFRVYREEKLPMLVQIAPNQQGSRGPCHGHSATVALIWLDVGSTDALSVIAQNHPPENKWAAVPDAARGRHLHPCK